MLEIKALNGIGVIGGNESKDCEYYDMGKNAWCGLPDLNNKRENPCCCVFNDETLYCFFGYDSKTCKYVGTIEKLNLQSKTNWEELTPGGQLNYLKRKSASCLNYKFKDEEFIIIVGGINTLNSESKDCILYNEKDNTMERKKNVLPYKCSFISNSYVPLVFGTLGNFTVDSLILQYEQLGQIFFETRES